MELGICWIGTATAITHLLKQRQPIRCAGKLLPCDKNRPRMSPSAVSFSLSSPSFPLHTFLIDHTRQLQSLQFAQSIKQQKDTHSRTHGDRTAHTYTHTHSRALIVVLSSSGKITYQHLSLFVARSVISSETKRSLPSAIDSVHVYTSCN